MKFLKGFRKNILFIKFPVTNKGKQSFLLKSERAFDDMQRESYISVFLSHKRNGF